MGILYGIGVGPGDPELITLKALRIIKESDIILVPGKKKEESVAYQIVKKAYDGLEDKQVIAIDMPMTKDAKQLEESHEKGAERIVSLLREGKQAAFLTLGDPCIYSTYLYLHKRILERGEKAYIMNGIPSFCAAAARLGVGLAEKAQPLHILPASYPIEDALSLSGTKVLMKAGKKMEEVKKLLCHREEEVQMVENCGMEQEKVYYGANNIPEDAGYYSLLIVKQKEEN